MGKDGHPGGEVERQEVADNSTRAREAAITAPGNVRPAGAYCNVKPLSEWPATTIHAALLYH